MSDLLRDTLVLGVKKRVLCLLWYFSQFAEFGVDGCAGHLYVCIVFCFVLCFVIRTLSMVGVYR